MGGGGIGGVFIGGGGGGGGGARGGPGRLRSPTDGWVLVKTGARWARGERPGLYERLDIDGLGTELRMLEDVRFLRPDRPRNTPTDVCRRAPHDRSDRGALRMQWHNGPATPTAVQAFRLAT